MTEKWDEPLYHSTTPEAAEAIVRDGFRDPDPNSDRTRKTCGRVGIWLSYDPKNSLNNVAHGDTLLEVKLAIDDLSQWEDSEPEADVPDKEFCIPADIVNSNADVRLLSEDEAEILRESWGGFPIGGRKNRRNKE